MKKMSTMLIPLVLCFALCACGKTEEPIELPARPTQPAVSENYSAVAEPQSTEPQSTESDEGKYPWEVEFREADYFKFNFTAPNGDKIVTWREGSVMGTERRCLYEYANDGTISDSYYYPSGNTSHEYTWYMDGSYIEVYYLDNGYMDPETRTVWRGTIVYQKNIYADGSENEQFFDEAGNVTRMITLSPDGNFSDTEYFENGNIKRSVFENSAGAHEEQENYENGTVKYLKKQTPDQVSEERFDEDGYRTYFYTKSSDWETELTADESGKLVKIVENGEAKEDAATLSQYAINYNFRG